MIRLLLLSFFLTACGGGIRQPVPLPAPLPPPPPPQPPIVSECDSYFDLAKAKIWALASTLPTTTFTNPCLATDIIWMATDGYGILRGRPGFLLTSTGMSRDSDIQAALAMGTDTDAQGRPLLQGWSPFPWRGERGKMFCLLEQNACPHEMVHWAWALSSRGSEFCPNGIGLVYNYVEHGGTCDPFD